MENTEVVEILGEAYESAKEANEYNQQTEKTIRASNAGKPLVELVLGDIIEPKLPKQKYDGAVDVSYKIKASMRVSTGYIFEKALLKVLPIMYPGFEVLENVEFQWRSIKGHSEFVIVNHESKELYVIECKALGTYGAKDTVEKKLMVDNWGYYTQLSVYMAAAQEKYPDYIVEGLWAVWCKKTEAPLFFLYPGGVEQAIDIANEAEQKAQEYFEVKRLLEERNFKPAAEYLLEHTVDLPEKAKAKAGYLYSTCGFHYSPLADLVTTEEGTLKEDALNVIILLMMSAFGNDMATLALITEYNAKFLTTPAISATLSL